MNNRSFLPLYATNFFGTVNDNFLKTLASFIVLGWIGEGTGQSVFVGITAAALVLPYILFSPLADRLTTFCSKVRIFRWAKVAEIPIVSLAILGFLLHEPAIVVGGIVLMGLQSALYSPAKYALVRDIGGIDRISTGMGGMEAISFAGVLAGTVAGSAVAGLDLTSGYGWVKIACLLGFASLGWLLSLTIRADEVRNRELHAINPIRYFRRCFRMARRYEGLNVVIFTLSVFWFAAAMLQMGLLVYGPQVLGLTSTETGCILALAAVGIVSGQIVAGFIDRRHFLLGATLVTGVIASILLAVIFFVRMNPVTFAVLLAVTAFDLGLFKLPFDTEIQRVVKGPRLNTMLAYFNQVSFLFMFMASGVYAALSWAWGPRAFLLFLAALFLVAPVVFVFHYRRAMCFVGRWIFTRRYRVEVENLPVERSGTTYLFLPNHPAMVDPMLVTAELWQLAVRPLSDELFLDRGGVSARVLKTLGTVKVPDLRKHRSEAGAKIARGLTGVVTDALARGRHIIFYPSGHIWTEEREEIGTRQLAYNVCRELPANVRVIGVRTRGLWGSIWSRKGRANSPAFAPTLLKSVLLWLVCLVTRRQRQVSMHFEDLTNEVRAWSGLTRLEFNRALEDWYNR